MFFALSLHKGGYLGARVYICFISTVPYESPNSPFLPYTHLLALNLFTLLAGASHCSMKSRCFFSSVLAVSFSGQRMSQWDVGLKLDGKVEGVCTD